MIKNILIAVVIIAVGVGAYLYYQSTQSSTSNTTDEISITAEPSEEPTKEPVKKSEYKIEVLNGSGFAGQAGVAEEFLKDKEFDVISTGNADNYDYEKTVIQAKKEVKDTWINELKDTLGEKYTVESSVEVKEDGDADVTVIIGKQDDNGDPLEEEPTDTPEETPTGTTTTTPTTTNTPSPSPTGT